MEGICPNLGTYSTQTCLEALKEYTLLHSKLFFDDKVKSKIVTAASMKRGLALLIFRLNLT
jgi:hypothetical protein